jgi:hypothetical protein
MRCLLDKATARLAAQGLLKLAEAGVLSEVETFSLDLFIRASELPHHAFIVPPSAAVFDRLADVPRYGGVIQLLRSRVGVAQPARYFRRWARRLRDLAFTREDAAVLALATFGTDAEAAILGMDFVATLDQHMINNWTARQAVIAERLAAMSGPLPEPYPAAPGCRKC